MAENKNESNEPRVPATTGARPPAKTSSRRDGRVERIVQETRQLSDELTDWVTLKLKLIQLDVQERIDDELDFVYSGVIVLGMVTIALLMASFGIAWALGDVLGERWYGFAIVAILYLIAAFIILRVRPRLAGGFRASWIKERLDRSSGSTEADQ